MTHSDRSYFHNIRLDSRATHLRHNSIRQILQTSNNYILPLHHLFHRHIDTYAYNIHTPYIHSHSSRIPGNIRIRLSNIHGKNS